MDNSEKRPDVQEIMSKIKAQVLSENKGKPSLLSRYIPPQSALTTGSSSNASVLYSDELNYLNANWSNWSEAVEFSSHRPLIGRLIVAIKRKIRDYLWNSLFKDYFERERKFQMELVRFLNAQAKYIDSRDAEIFWQLVKKIDSDIQGVNERGDRLFEEYWLTQKNSEYNLFRSNKN